MDKKEFSDWLKEEGLSHFIDDYVECFKSIFINNIDPFEKITIISDEGYPKRRASAIMAGCYMETAKQLNVDCELVLQNPKSSGESADEKVIEALLTADNKTLLLLSLSGKLGSLKQVGKSFRKYTQGKGISFLSTTGLEELETDKFPKFMEAIDIDYEKLRERGKIIKEELDKGKEIHIKSENGTDLTFSKGDYKGIINDGFYKNKKGGNMPVGEVYLAIEKNKANGILVIDVSSKNKEGTSLVKEDILTIIVKEGEVIDIKGGESAKRLKESFEWAIEKAKLPWGVKLLSEFGIGINPKAEILGPTVINEKKLGTCHIAIGSNSWFGGDIFAVTHFDQVFNNPTIEIDGKPLDLKKIFDSTS